MFLKVDFEKFMSICCDSFVYCLGRLSGAQILNDINPSKMSWRMHG